MNMQDRVVFKIAQMYYKKSWKKYIGTTVFLSLAFIILICIVFLSVSFDFGYKNKMNEDKTLLSCQTRTDNDELESKLKDIITKDSNINESISFKESYINYYSYKEYPSWQAPSVVCYPIIELDGIVYDYKEECESLNQTRDEICFYDTNSKLVLDREYEYAKKNSKDLIVGGNNQIGNNMLYISSKFCDFYNLNYESIIGKSISYKCYIDKDSTINVIDNYIILGVFKDDIYDIPTRYMQSEDTPLFWLPMDEYTKINENLEMENYNISILTFNDFSSLKSSINTYLNFYNQNSSNVYIEMADLTRYYIKISPIMFISKCILLLISLFVIIIGILNLFHNILYVSTTSLNFLDMCQTIGLRKKDRKAYTIILNSIIFIPSIIFSILISFIISIILSNKLNDIIILNKALNNTLVFDMKYYFLVASIFLILIILVMLIMSLCVDKSISKFKMNNKKN
jgi:hypothetical protein